MPNLEFVGDIEYDDHGIITQRAAFKGGSLAVSVTEEWLWKLFPAESPEDRKQLFSKASRVIAGQVTEFLATQNETPEHVILHERSKGFTLNLGSAANEFHSFESRLTKRSSRPGGLGCFGYNLLEQRVARRAAERWFR